MKSKLNNFVNLFAASFVFLANILLELIGVRFQKQAFLSILLSSALMLICWFLIKFFCYSFGNSIGDVSDGVTTAKKAHKAKADQINKTDADFSEWCIEKTKNDLKDKRALLLGGFLKYNEYFNEDGEYTNKTIPLPQEHEIKAIAKQNKILYKEQLKRLKKARALKVAPYIASEILTRTIITTTKNRYGRTQAAAKKTALGMSLVFSALLSFLFAYTAPFGVAKTSTAIIIMFVKVLIMLGSAFLFFAMGLNYMIGEYRLGLVEKAGTMEEFLKHKGIELPKIEEKINEVKNEVVLDIKRADCL